MPIRRASRSATIAKLSLSIRRGSLSRMSLLRHAHTVPELPLPRLAPSKDSTTCRAFCNFSQRPGVSHCAPFSTVATVHQPVVIDTRKTNNPTMFCERPLRTANQCKNTKAREQMRQKLKSLGAVVSFLHDGILTQDQAVHAMVTLGTRSRHTHASRRYRRSWQHSERCRSRKLVEPLEQAMWRVYSDVRDTTCQKHQTASCTLIAT